MDYKQEEKSTQTIVLDKQTKSAESTQPQPSVHTALNINLFSSDSLTKKQPEPTAVTESQDKDEKLEKLKQQIMQTQREKQQKELEIKKAEKEQQKAEAKKEEQREEEQEKVVESLYDASLLIKPSENEDVEKELQNLTNEGQKSYKFRFRLLTGVFCCIMAILVGWIIGNSIELATTSEQIASSTATQEEYNVNIAEYLSKISRLDSDVQQSDGPKDDSLLPIDEIITITPQPLEDPTAYEEESNWFDSICNWLIHLFGG